MDFENKENPQQEGSFDDVLGAPLVEEEIGPDEQAVASAGLIHPDDMELEMIIAEHRPEDAEDLFLPEKPAAQAFFPEEAEHFRNPVGNVFTKLWKLPCRIDQFIRC